MCAVYVPKKRRLHFNSALQERFKNVFGVMPTITDWCPSTVCPKCSMRLKRYNASSQQRAVRPTATTWHEPRNHPIDCYFCCVVVRGNRACKYPTGTVVTLGTWTCTRGRVKRRHAQTVQVQQELNRLVCEEHLSLRGCERVARRLKRLLACRLIRTSLYRCRGLTFRALYSNEDGVTYCNNVPALMASVRVQYSASEWRLFVDASKSSLKAVLLHNGNRYRPIPVAYTTSLRETYDSLRLLLNKVKYAEHQWLFCGDLKVIAIVSGLKPGYPRHPCFLCCWNSRAHHQSTQFWPERHEDVVGDYSVIHEALVPRAQILQPPLHIKLGVGSCIVRSLVKTPEILQFFCTLFPTLSVAKITAGVLNGPDIRTLFNHRNALADLLSTDQQECVDAYRDVCEGFLGNDRAVDYKVRVAKLLHALRTLNINMTLKVHLLHAHLDRFPRNCGEYSDEQGEHFHQLIKPFETRYKSRSVINMLADYCWSAAVLNLPRVP